MKKWSMYATWSILGVVAVGGVASTGLFYSKYKTVKDGIDNNGIKVQIAMFDKGSTTATKTKIYTVQKGEATLEDLMLDHPNDFKLSSQTQYGRFIEVIYGISADAVNKEFWEITSETYLLSHPENKGNGHQSKREHPLNVGVSGVVLTSPQIINFYLSTY